MKMTDVTNLTQNAVAQLLGMDYYVTQGTTNDDEGNTIPNRVKVGDAKLAALSSYELADIGKDVLNSGSLDSYVKTLLTQMGKMVVDAKKYTADIPSIFVDSFDWGGYVERVYFAPQDIIQDDMYNLIDGKTYDDHKFYKPNASAKIFEEAKTILTPISITRDQMQMAFNSWEQMNSFLSGIYTNVENTIVLALEAYAHLLICCGIAVACKATTTQNEVKLLTEYNETHTTTIETPEAALNNADFLKFALSRIAETRDNMRRYTAAFNNGSIPTFTTGSDSKLAILNKFANIVKFNVRANTFNEELLGIGEYDKISAWQAFSATSKPDFDFNTISTVMLAADSTNKLGIGTAEVTIKNVIGVAYDHRAMGLCPHKSKVTTNYTAIADFWNEYHHTLVNYVLDTNYNIVVFTLN